MSIVRHKVYGGDTRPTIYYLTGYGGKIKRYRPHLYALMLGGFRLVVFEYDKTILTSGNPDKLLGALKDIEKFIKQDKKEHEVAGIYGISLGSWLGGNIIVACDIQKAIFNSGAVSIVNVVWNNSYMKAEKAAFQKHGHDLAELRKLWGPYDFNADGNRFAGKKVMVLSSTTDNIIDFKEASHNIHSWRKNVDVELITTSNLNHGPAIGRHMLRLRRTLKFFKKTKKQKQEVVSYPNTNRRG